MKKNLQLGKLGTVTYFFCPTLDYQTTNSRNSHQNKLAHKSKVHKSQAKLTGDTLKFSAPGCFTLLAGSQHQMTQACYFVRGKCDYSYLAKNCKEKRQRLAYSV